MKILFLLSCLEPSGSETYCVSLARAWGNRHDVSWISDRLHFGQRYTSLAISRKAVPGGLFNTYHVAKFIRDHQIEVVHSHSRRAHWVAAQAAWLTGIAHVTTVHQPLPRHFFSRLFPCLGHMTMAIDEAVAESVTQEFHIPARQVRIVRNGIFLDDFVPSRRDTPGLKRIFVIGRLSGGRWEAIQFFLQTLERAGTSLPPAHYSLVGQVPEFRRAELARQLSGLNARLAPAKVDTLGFLPNLAEAVREADGVIAAGRSAMESLALARPVIFLGEGGCLGLSKPETWPRALQTNFGDHLRPPAFHAPTLESALRELIASLGQTAALGPWGRSQVEKDFNITTVAAQVEAVYADAIQRRKKGPKV